MPLTKRQTQLALYRELANEARDRALDESRSVAVKYDQYLESKQSATAAVVSTWQVPPAPLANYDRVAREGYGANEIIYACIEELCTSAAEPVLAAYDHQGNRFDKHELLDLLNNPNPFMTGYDYIASLIMYRSIAGNSYTEKVFPNVGSKPKELWLIRPDRMTVLPDPQDMIGGYRFRLGNFTYDYPIDEIMHYKIRNPLDHRYGMAPMQILLERTDTDNFARTFTKSFFYNAGVPSTLLSFKSILDDQERGMIQSRFRRDFTGATGWHNVMVTEENEVDVKQLGMPMGARGIAYPELDEINEARIAMVFGVPPTLIGARLGVKGGSYANRLADREGFWNDTLSPIYSEIEANFNKFLVPHYPDVAYVMFDMSTVQALTKDTDVVHARYRNNFINSLMGWRESRKALGVIGDPKDDDIMMLPANMHILTFADFKKAINPQPAPVQYQGWHNAQQGDTQNNNGAHTTPDVRPQVPAGYTGHSNGNGNHP